MGWRGPGKLPLLPGSDSGTCPGPVKQTPRGMSSGSSHTSSPRRHPGEGIIVLMTKTGVRRLTGGP